MRILALLVLAPVILFATMPPARSASVTLLFDPRDVFPTLATLCSERIEDT
jgi:hypothetical protein